MTSVRRKIATAPSTEGTYGKWKGHDWTEISEFLGVDLENEDEVVAEETRKRLNELRNDACQGRIGGTYPELSKQKIKEIRRFIEKVIEQAPHDTPLWQGLLAMADDALFLEYVDRLLECLWT
ncbi:hypothetical protein HYR99_20420 [Candidatus Poribacteria bacterium]|nr:hypothetical protein [Candidatus Poribacteria bacterium]